MITINKRLLCSLVTEIPKTAIQLYNDYQRVAELFADSDQIQAVLDVLTALNVLVSDGEIKSRAASESEASLTWAYIRKNPLAAGIPQTLFYQDAPNSEQER